MRELERFGPVWFIRGQNNGKYPYCHSIYVEGAGVLIDPGSDRKLLKHLRENQGVKVIWLSHWHEDHMMHLDLFDDLPIWISKEDAPPLSDIEVFLEWYGMENEDFRNDWCVTLMEKFHLRPRKPARFISGGELIDLGNVTVEVISTPGHTPGHLSFFFKEPEALFMGDYDLTNFGPWYGDLFSSIEDTIASVERLKSIPAKVWFTSHENGIFRDEPGKLWDDYLSVIKKREERLYDLLKKPRTMQEIVIERIVYRKEREPKEFFDFCEWVLMKKHIERLMEQNLVEVKGERYRRSHN